MAIAMTMFDPSIAVIVGGIAGMTLSMTGMKNMYDLGKEEFSVKNKIDNPALFTTKSKAAWAKVIRNTVLLVSCFFISEIIVLMYFLSGDGASGLGAMGYYALIVSLGFMIFLYIWVIWDFQHPPKKMEKFQTVERYPEPQDPRLASAIP